MKIIELYNDKSEASLDIVLCPKTSEKNQYEFYSSSQYFLNKGYDSDIKTSERLSKVRAKTIEARDVILFFNSTCFKNDLSLTKILRSEILKPTQYVDLWNCKEFTWSCGNVFVGVYWGAAA